MESWCLTVAWYTVPAWRILSWLNLSDRQESYWISVFIAYINFICFIHVMWECQTFSLLTLLRWLRYSKRYKKDTCVCQHVMNLTATEVKCPQNLVHIELEETSLPRMPHILLKKKRNWRDNFQIWMSPQVWFCFGTNIPKKVANRKKRSFYDVISSNL